MATKGTNNVNITAGLIGIASKSGSSNVSLDKTVRIAAPKNFGKKDIASLQRGCEVLLEHIQKNPEKVQALIKFGLAGNMLAAANVVRELKLGKGDSVGQGGWIIFLIILIIVVWCMLYEEE
jgi:hypothetical protein